MGPPKTIEEQVKILTALTNKYNFDFESGVKSKDKAQLLKDVSAALPLTLSNADLKGLVSMVVNIAVKRSIANFEDDLAIYLSKNHDSSDNDAESLSIEDYCQQTGKSSNHYEVSLSVEDFNKAIEQFLNFRK